MRRRPPLRKNPKVFLLDVDGVLTTGHFLYSAAGKQMKIFGPDDHDALGALQPHLPIRFITADRRGWPISRKRVVQDMGFSLDLVGTLERTSWILKHYEPSTVIYMGDGIFDSLVMREVGYAIAPANADVGAKKNAHYVTRRKGGDRAVAEACLHILKKFFGLKPEDLQPH